MLRKLVPTPFIRILYRSCNGTITLLVLPDAHDISQRSSGHCRGFVRLLLPFALLSSFPNHLAPLSTKHGHVALRIAHRRHRLQLLGEDRPPIEKRRSKVVDEQVNPSPFFILRHEVVAKISPLRNARREHAIRLPVVNVFAFCIA